MFDKLAAKTARYLIYKQEQAGKDVHKNDYAKLVYMLGALYSTVLETAVYLVVVALLGIFWQTMLALVVYAILRIFSFGFHLQTVLGCIVLSLAYFLGSVYLARLALPLWVACVLLALSLAAFIRYAPAETRERPISATQRPALKKKALFVFAIFAVLVIALHLLKQGEYANLVLFAMVCQTINILPISYRLFGASQ